MLQPIVVERASGCLDLKYVVHVSQHDDVDIEQTHFVVLFEMQAGVFGQDVWRYGLVIFK
jgi:hypothetical protein